jgi:hypothetical protein
MYSHHVRSVRAGAVGVGRFGAPPSRGTVNVDVECLRQPARAIWLFGRIRPPDRDQPFRAACGLSSVCRPIATKCVHGAEPDRSTGHLETATVPVNSVFVGTKLVRAHLRTGESTLDVASVNRLRHCDVSLGHARGAGTINAAAVTVRPKAITLGEEVTVKVWPISSTPRSALFHPSRCTHAPI